MLFFSLAFVLAGSSFPASGFPEATTAVTYQGVVYISLDRLAEFCQGTVTLPRLARELQMEVRGKTWKFVDGGRRLQLPDGTQKLLKRPLLVLGGKGFCPLEETAPTLGLKIIRKPQLAVQKEGKEWVLQPRPIDSPYYGHRVRDLRQVHEVVVLQEPLQEPLGAIRSLHKKGDRQHLSPGTTLLIRRKASLDGIPHVLASDCGISLESFLIPEKSLEGKVKLGNESPTTWHRCRQRFEGLALKETALRHGDRKHLKRTAALTVDLCWSLRSYESRLFRSLEQLAGDKKIHPVVFISGRWLDQHPLEMHDLIRLSQQPGVDLVWGLHSWEHPKADGFMNDFSPAQLRQDTLKLEQRLLEWGVVPTVYYRFPGLIHDRPRLREILEMDLFPVDCDCWLALVRHQDRLPFYQKARDGSIILVHGNGNEPAGIPRLENWLQAHPDWELGPLNRFMVFPEDAPK